MKITYKEREEITKVYETWLNSYLTGDVETYDSFFDDRYRFIGSTDNEDFLNKEDTTKFFKETADQLSGKLKIKNNMRTIENIESLIFVTELIDADFLIEGEWTYYGKFRLTSVLKRNNEGWRFVYQHFSTPDSKADAGETIGTEKIAAENLMLRDAVKRRTIELENKNRELEIEAALEKVRTVAMSMKQPEDMLEVCMNISLQLQSLGLNELRNVQTAIFYEQRGTYMNYEYYSKHDKTIVTETTYTNNKTHKAFAAKMLKGKGEIFITHIKGKKVKEWIEYQKTTNVFIDKYLNKASSLNYYWFSLGPVALGVSTYHPLTETEIDLFKRFLKVFELAYQRYLDIEKAETQAREAKIEAALEKVRSRSLAMHTSDEFVDASDVMVNQLKELGINTLRIGIGIINKDDGSVEIWSKSEIKGKVKNTILGVVPRGVHPIFDNMVDAWKEKKSFYSSTRVGDEVKEYYEKLDPCLSYTKRKKFNERETMTAFFFNHGSLNVISLQPLKEEDCNIMIRFAKVFGQIYQRFLDLQIAEAQTREAQIEASLERVRSVAMSMMKSDELLKVCESVFSELRVLGFNETDLRNTQIVINNDEKEIYNGYQYSDYTGGEIAEVPYDMHPIIRMLNDKLKQSTDAFADIEISGEAMDDWKAFVKSFPQKPDKKLNAASELHYYFYSVGIGALGISSFKSLPEDKLQILQRLRNVFNLSYQRYVDISQSEAQAREAQIELALERVRARTMGMQKSGELKDVIRVIYDQFVQLSINIEHTGFIVDYKTRDDMHIWLADKNGPLSEIIFPYFDSPHWNSFIDAKEKGLDFFANHLNFDEKNKFYKKLFTFIPDLPEEAKNFYFNCPGLAISTVLLDNVGLYIENFSGIPYSDEENKILMRFGKVFQQTYTRFLDLQKAEAQAREAQIETALERIRSKSLGMYKTDDLRDVVSVLFEQMQGLSVDMGFASVSIFIFEEESRNFNQWIQLPDDVMSLSVPYFEHPINFDLFDAKAGGADYFAKVYTVEEKNSWLEKGFVLTDYKNLPEEFRTSLLEAPGYAMSTTIAKNSGICIPSFIGKLPSAEDVEIMKRVSNVFEQAYIRFLDLQKAEAQAREAKIEAALEKVRSRSLAMHKSEEIRDVVVTVMEKMNELNIDMNGGVSLATFVPDSNDLIHWYVNPDHVDGPVTMHLPYFKNVLFYDFIEARKSGKEILPVVYSFEEKNKYFEYAFEHSDFRIIHEDLKKWILEQPSFGYSVAIQKHSAIFFNDYTGKLFTEKENDVLLRFAKVFDQAYIRFLDLQKAEAQAREAIIEAALEKVRSRSLAMHSSKEMQSVANTVYEQLKALEIEMDAVGMSGVIESKNDYDVWIGGSSFDRALRIPFNESTHVQRDYNEIIEKRAELFSKTYSGKNKKEYINHLLSHGSFPNELKKLMLESDAFSTSISFTKNSGIQIARYTAQPYSAEDNEILIRFAKVFEQAYIRFLDLQKAEAQARESQIEVSLERVRAKAMAMHSSEDLVTIIDTFFKELKILKVSVRRCGVGFVNEKTRIVDVIATSSKTGELDSNLKGKLKLSGHPILDEIFETWKAKKEYHPILRGNEIKEYYRVMNPQIEYPDYPTDEVQYGYYFHFKEGGVFTWTENPLLEEELSIFRRFTSVLSLTLRRFMDLQQAELRTREAEQQGSLDRVRAEIASMRTTNDLEKITPLIWRELTALGVPFFRCGVFIIDETNELVYAYLSTPKGNSLAALKIKLKKGVWVEKAVQNWRKGKSYYEVWDREQFMSWTKVMMEEGFVENKEHFQDGKEAPETLSLQLLPFNQGMLYIGSEARLSEEEIELGRKLANDFSVAYSRYEDFQKMEEANNRKSAELEEARQLQLGMLPKETPKLNNLEIAAYMETATEVGGDYYDFNIDEDGSLTVVVGDATGHGMKAGTIVTITKSLFNSSSADNNILETFSKISKVIKEMKFRQLSMCLLMLKIKDYKLSISSAAMPPIFIYRGKTKTVDEILIKGMPLGAISNFPYSYEETQLQKGDNILLMSDGFPELMNADGEIYGYERTRELFRKIGSKKPEEIISKLKDTGVKWLKGREPDDDVTFVVLKVK